MATIHNPDIVGADESFAVDAIVGGRGPQMGKSDERREQANDAAQGFCSRMATGAVEVADRLRSARPAGC